MSAIQGGAARALVLGLLLTTGPRGAAAGPDDPLSDHGLRRAGPTYVLPEEPVAALRAELDHVGALRERYRAAAAAVDRAGLMEARLREIAAAVAAARHARAQYHAQVDLIHRNLWRGTRAYSLNSEQLAQVRALEAARDACDRTANDLELERADLAGRLPGPVARREQEEAAGACAAALGAALIAARRAVDPILVRYRALERTPAVAEALAAARHEAGDPGLRLGPSGPLAALVRALEEAEGAIATATVEARRVVGLWRVPATFNSVVAADLVLDPRAGVTTIPAALAERAGLVPDPAARAVRRRTPEGVPVDARVVRAASLRIGSLILGDVALEVWPADAGDFPPRLGMDLRRRVRCQVVPETGQVVVARAAGTPPRLGRRAATAR